MIEFELEDGTTKLVAPNAIDRFMEQFPGATRVDSESVQDRTAQPNIVIPEIDPNAPLSSGDFYSILQEDDGEKTEEKQEKEKIVDREIIPELPTAVTDASMVYQQPTTGAFEEKTVVKNKELAAKDQEVLEAWLNEEYFGKGGANQAMGTDNIIAYQINDPTLSDLKKDFKSNLGELNISRTAFKNLSDSDLDDIFGEVFSTQVRSAQAKEGEKDERIKINDIISKKEKDKTDAEAIEVSVDRLDNAKINSYKNKDEALFAQLVKKLRNGQTTIDIDGKEISIEKYLDPEIPGSLGDRLFNKDKMEYDINSRMMMPTGERIPKDEKYEIFHDPVSGKNVNAAERKAIENNGGTVVNVTDAYEAYLTSFKNTSQDDLAKYNSRLLLEEAGYNMENEEVGDYYIGDRTMRNALRQRGYKSDGQGVFQDVPLGVLTQLSHIPGTWDFWSPDSYMSKGEIIPQDFKDKPYKNEEEFVEFLQTRRKQGNDIAAKNAALKQVYYLNRDPSTISKNRIGQFAGAFAQSMFGETITAEQFQPTNQKIIDVIGSQVVPESGVDITEQQKEIFERTFADEATEAGGGLLAMLTVLSPINKAQKALGINRMIAGLSAPRYINKAGKSITQSKAIKEASKVGKDLDDWAKAGGYTLTPASSLQKGIGLVTLGVYEDIKMREVLGAVTDGRMEFERGVGFGFALAPKVLPYGFGRFGRGKKYDLTTGRNQLNTFLQSTFVNAPSFALAVEGGDALGAIVKDIEGKEEYETWAKNHWADRDKNMRRIGLNLITGKALGLMHFNSMDFKTTESIGKFKIQSAELMAKDIENLRKDIIKEYKIVDPAFINTKLNEFIVNNPKNKNVKNYQKHVEDYNLATQRLDMINNSAEWTDPAKAKKTYENHYKPLTELFKSKGKEIKIEVTDKPIYQTVNKGGRWVKQEVSALYTKLGTGKNKNIATIQINTKKAKGKQYANHEALHAYLDIMFEGKGGMRLKKGLEVEFRKALESIKTENSNLYLDVLGAVKRGEIAKGDKLEEMMAYTAEYLGKAENYNSLVSNQAFAKIKKFWNNVTESTLNKKADLTTKQDIIDILGIYGRTGDIKKLERLNEIIEFDPTVKTREGQVATTDINKTVEQIKSRKEDILQEIKDLRTAKPKGYEKIIEEKRAIFNEINANQRKLENKAEIEKVDAAKQADWKNQVDKNYTGTYKTQKEFQKSLEYGRVSNDILTSKGLENMIRQAATKVGVAEGKKEQFVSDVKDRILERFLKNYDPGKINAEYGRALTPFEYLTTGQKGGTSIIYRSAGDVMNKFKETVEITSYDAFEKGAEAFTTEYGYTKSTDATGSKVEQEGIVVSEALKLPKSVEQKAAGDTKNLDFETTKAKEKVSYKNIGKNSKIIEKDIVVDYYGVSPEIYKKMQKDPAQQLNNADINAVQNKIKENIETHIKLLPRGLQVIIDPISGENVALKTVAGVPSEAKATGTTTVLLRNPLLYKEIKQTGTKGSKYEYSNRLKEYHKTLDPVVKKKFEQDVLDSWGMGETQLSKAQLSGIYKGIMTQTRKAVYVQSVNKQLPNTPELTIKFALANMINQISAGKSPTLATKANINDLIKLVQKQKVTLEDVARLSGNIPGVKVLEEIIMERDALTKDTDIIKANEKYQRELEGKTETELDVIYAESVSRSKEIAKKNGLSEKHADPNYIAKNPGEKIKGVELAEWRKKLDAEVVKEFGFDLKDLEALATKKGQKNHHALESLLVEFGFGSKSRKQTLSDGSTVYLNKEGRTSAEAIEAFLGEKFTTVEGKSASKYEKVYRPDWSSLKKKLDKLEKEMRGKSIEDIKDAKIELYRKEASHSGKSKDFEATEKANREFFEDYFIALAKVAYKNKNNYGIEYMLQSRAMQTNHAKSISKSLGYKMASLNAMGSKPGEIKTTSAKGEVKTKDNKGISSHWEHALQLLNQTNRFVDLIRKHKSVTPAFKKGLKDILDVSNQHLIPKNGQLFNDAKGPTTFTKSYTEMLKKGIDNPLLNVFANKYARLENNFIVSGPNKGKSLLDVQLENLDLNIAKKVLKNIPESQWGLFEYQLNNKIKAGKKIEIQNRNVLSKSIGKKMAKTVASKDINKVIKIVDKALENGRNKNKKSRGMSTFDFDETLIDKGKNFIIATKGKDVVKISSGKWPVDGPKYAEQGYKFDFKDFVNVRGGVEGPLLQKMRNQIKKFGPENVFVLTARPAESAPAIQAWLKSKGIDIKLENITGLGNSTGEAKAMWMLEKFAEGYNDMYFVDDAISNVKAVRDVLNQLDIKSKVQQALASKDLNKDVNKIMEHSLGIGSEKVFSKAEAKVRGKDIKRRRVFMRDSAADLELLIEPLYGKGKKGIENKKWFRENFVMPFERGIRDYNKARQSAKNDYLNLRRQNKDVVKQISKPVEGTTFTNDMAMRVYLWNKAGYKIPDLAKSTEAKLVEHINNNPKLKAYAEQFARITKQEKGLKEPKENWWAETMAGEVTSIDRGVSRKQYLQEFIDVKNEIFNEANLNKMESKLGTRWRENIEDMFDRMETGRTRSIKMDRGSAMMMNYLNGGIGTIMNFNTRSAVLQTISTANFLNMRENNPVSAARAMANTKQFVKDFKFIMNSDMLKQRRDGLAMNVTEAELASAAVGSKNPIQSIIAKVLKAGYLPTKFADSFAISFGGATFYRNRIKMYERQGMSTKQAEKQAFLDFQVLAERTQQSSRADLLSKQQTSLIGRFILPFANTPMQMNRAGMKDILDISKGRFKGGRELTEKIGRITYYMGAQVAIFAGLQSALFAMLLNDDDVTEEQLANTKSMMLNSVTDSFLRGFGIQGAIMSSFKNATQEYFKQSAKGFRADYSEVGEDLLNISPPIGSKFGMLDRAGDRIKFDKTGEGFKFKLGNPSLEASLMTIQATTNAPVYSPYQNMFNLRHALSDKYELWQRVLMGTGWTPYSVGVETEKKKKKKKKKKSTLSI